MRLRQIATIPYRLVRYAWRAWRDARPAARKHHISVLRIIREQIVLKRRRGLQPSEYFYFGLDDPEKTWEEKLAYVGHDQGPRLWSLFTPEKYYCIYKNKLIFNYVFGSMGFPVAQLYGTYDPDWGQTVDGAPLRTAEDIAAWMADKQVADPVFKPTESAEGRMVFVMKGRKPGNPRVFIGMDGEEYTPERLVQALGDPEALREAYPDQPVPYRTFLVEERLKPHAEIVEITSSDTLCCLRLVTLLTARKTVEIIGTYFKVQPRSIGADNLGEDMLLVYVDPVTGKLGEGVFYDGKERGERYRCHPDGGTAFYGRTLPLWKEAVELAGNAAKAFPQARTVGWDIAMTPRGVFLVEGNTCWGYPSVQFVADKGIASDVFMETCRLLE